MAIIGNKRQPTPITDEEIIEEIFSKYEPMSWTEKDGSQIIFPIISIRERRSKRNVHQERTYRPGAKIDSTGWKVRTWTVRACFNNTIIEDGIPETPALYPDVLNQLVASFDQDATGDAILPTQGLRRCRILSYERVEMPEESDEASLDLVFEEDSEDVLDIDSLEVPSVRANTQRLANQTTFSGQSIGSFISDLRSNASDIEFLMTSPGRDIQDINNQVLRARRDGRTILRTEQTLGRRIGGFFQDPDSHECQRQIIRNNDMQARAADEKNSDQPRTVEHKVKAQTTLLAIAASLDQDPVLIIQINAKQVDDPMDVRQGSTVLVFEKKQAA